MTNVGNLNSASSSYNWFNSGNVPSADIEERYKSHLFELASGDNIIGSIVKQSSKTITIAQPDGKQITINKKAIDDQRSSKLSIMPDMTKALTLDQFRDLVAYLSTLK